MPGAARIARCRARLGSPAALLVLGLLADLMGAALAHANR
jgi:hypothetical protein